MTSWMIYRLEQIKELKKSNPKMNYADIIKQISMNWKNLNEEYRFKYGKMNLQDKDRYAEEMK